MTNDPNTFSQTGSDNSISDKLPRHTRRKVLGILIGLLLLCITSSYLIFLTRQINSLLNPTPEHIYRYVTSTPVPTQQNLRATVTTPPFTETPSSSPTPSVTPTALPRPASIDHITAMGDALYIVINKSAATELWRTTGHPHKRLRLITADWPADYNRLNLIPHQDGSTLPEMTITLNDINSQRILAWLLNRFQALNSINPEINPFHPYSIPLDEDTRVFYQTTENQSGRLIANDKHPYINEILTQQTLSWSPINAIAYNKGILFQGTNNTLWFTDGTAVGTAQLYNLYQQGHRLSEQAHFTRFGKSILFMSIQINRPSRTLWLTDGSSSGTIQLTNPLTRSTDRSLSIALFTDSKPALWLTDTHIFFLTTEQLIDPNNHWNGQLWASTGTAEDTQVLHTFTPPNKESIWPIPEIVVTNDTLYFFIEGENGGTQLWQSDGTENGTISVIDVPTEAEHNTQPSQLTTVEDTLYFTTPAENGVSTILWSYTQENGIQPSFDANVYNWQDITHLTAIDNYLFFSAKTADQGPFLWSLNNQTKEVSFFDPNQTDPSIRYSLTPLPQITSTPIITVTKQAPTKPE